MQPFAVFEEVTCIIGIKPIPPLLRIGVEAMFVIGRDWVLALVGVLGFGVEIVGFVGFDVIPRIELEDVVGREEVS